VDLIFKICSQIYSCLPGIRRVQGVADERRRCQVRFHPQILTLPSNPRRNGSKLGKILFCAQTNMLLGENYGFANCWHICKRQLIKMKNTSRDPKPKADC